VILSHKYKVGLIPLENLFSHAIYMFPMRFDGLSKEKHEFGFGLTNRPRVVYIGHKGHSGKPV
jgi:hypothetical protein